MWSGATEFPLILICFPRGALEFTLGWFLFKQIINFFADIIYNFQLE